MGKKFKVRKRTSDTLVICDEDGQWWVKERPMNRNHKGQPCIYPNGPPLCQEGYCDDCAIPQKTANEIIARLRQAPKGSIGYCEVFSDYDVALEYASDPLLVREIEQKEEENVPTLLEDRPD